MGAKKGSSSSDKSYTLRACSIQKRMETETRKRQPKKRGPKPRPKSAPMSKYRRKTANQRERMRMGEINVAFEKLRDKGSAFSRGQMAPRLKEWPIQYISVIVPEVGPPKNWHYNR